MRTRVKFCGVTRPEDAVAAASLGADAIGLVFHRASPRAVTPEQARAIVAALPPLVTVVGLFVDPPRERVEAALDAVHIDLLQFHGDECPADCGSFGVPYIKAIRMQPGLDVAGYAQAYPEAKAVLLDAYRAGLAGGTGETFDWSQIPAGLERPLILAGGLTPANVAEAIGRVRPYAVDVSGGIEAAKGIKDPGKMAAFMSEVRRVER